MVQICIQIKETQQEIKVINNILKQIKKEDPVLLTFIKLRYIDKSHESLRKIAVEMNYSEDSNHTIYDIKNKSLREFAIRYYGAVAQKAT